MSQLQSHQFLTLKDGTKLRVKIVDNGNTNWLVCLHGLGEHLERHLYVKDHFGKKYNYLYLDHRGHGMSGGKRASIEFFSQFSQDLKEVISFLLSNYEVNKYGIYAHSMGALITCDFYKNVMGTMQPPAMIFFSAPAVGFQGIGKILQYSPTSLTNWIKDIPMSFQIEGESDHHRYSHNPKVLQDLLSDPLVNQNTESKLQFEILHKGNELIESDLVFSIPVAVVVGSADIVVCSQTAIDFFSKESRAQKVVVIPGGYHELFVETPKYKKPYMQSLNSFILANLKADEKCNETKLRTKLRAKVELETTLV